MRRRGTTGTPKHEVVFSIQTCCGAYPLLFAIGNPGEKNRAVWLRLFMADHNLAYNNIHCVHISQLSLPVIPHAEWCVHAIVFSVPRHCLLWAFAPDKWCKRSSSRPKPTGGRKWENTWFLFTIVIDTQTRTANFKMFNLKYTYILLNRLTSDSSCFSSVFGSSLLSSATVSCLDMLLLSCFTLRCTGVVSWRLLTWSFGEWVPAWDNANQWTVALLAWTLR